MQKTLAILFLLICFSSFTVSAQSLSHSVINTTGNFHQNTSGSLTYSIGENAFMTLQDNPYWLSQGFLQGDDSAVITSLDAKIENHHFKVYPNPTVDKIKVETDLQTLATVIISLFRIPPMRASLINNRLKNW